MRDKISVILMASLAAFTASKANAADATSDAVADIIARYNRSRSAAEGVCSGLSGKIDSVKMMAGIGIATGAVGAIGGGAGAVSGVMKMRADKAAATAAANASAQTEKPAEEAEESIEVDNTNEQNDNIEAYNAAGGTEEQESSVETPITGSVKSGIFANGTVRTVGSFVAGGSNAVGAVVQISGSGTLDEVIADMDTCRVHVKDIESQALELRMVAPDEPTLAAMDAIAQNCNGMNPKNIEDVKGKLKTAGIFSVVGGVAGIAGGVTSMMAARKENQAAVADVPSGGAEGTDVSGNNGQKSTKVLNMASTIASGTAAVAGLGGAILSGVTLSGLNKNSDIAKRCGDAFSM